MNYLLLQTDAPINRGQFWRPLVTRGRDHRITRRVYSPSGARLHRLRESPSSLALLVRATAEERSSRTAGSASSSIVTDEIARSLRPRQGHGALVTESRNIPRPLAKLQAGARF